MEEAMSEAAEAGDGESRRPVKRPLGGSNSEENGASQVRRRLSENSVVDMEVSGKSTEELSIDLNEQLKLNAKHTEELDDVKERLRKSENVVEKLLKDKEREQRCQRLQHGQSDVAVNEMKARLESIKEKVDEATDDRAKSHRSFLDAKRSQPPKEDVAGRQSLLRLADQDEACRFRKTQLEGKEAACEVELESWSV